jgi:hypothetical protein
MEATMNYMSLNRERLILTGPHPRILRRVTAWVRIAAIVSDPDLISVTMFCVIGLLLTFIATLAVPNFAALAESLQQFL